MLLAALICTGCGGPDSVLILLLEDESLPADGESTTTVTVRVWFDDDPVHNEQIDLAVTAGHFEGNRTRTNVRTTAGEASIKWYAPYERHGRPFEGDVTFTASYEDAYRNQQEAKAILQMVAPPPINGTDFRFWCDAKNIQRPSAATGPIRLPCSVEARDINGRQVPVDDVRFGFMAETGRLGLNDKGELEWVLSPGERPKVVEPLGDAATGEPRWRDQSAGVTRNPRDGIATLVVHTHGRPTGSTDPLQGEPFVDENDDGQWNPGEPYYDANDNGEYDGPTGSTEDRRIWRWTKIMVTGPISQTAPEDADGLSLWDTGEHSRQNIRIPRGTEVSVGLLLVDENLNPIASHPGRNPDFVQIGHSPSGTVSPQRQDLTEEPLGLTFDELTGQVDSGSIRAGYLQGRLTYFFRVENRRSADDEGDPVPWSIDSVEVKRIPRPGASQITERLDGHELPRGYLD